MICYFTTNKNYNNKKNTNYNKIFALNKGTKKVEFLENLIEVYTLIEN